VCAERVRECQAAGHCTARRVACHHVIALSDDTNGYEPMKFWSLGRASSVGSDNRQPRTNYFSS